MAYDAFLLVSFGGPEQPDDVLPFLENVTRGRGVPPERLAEVAEHYQHFGGVSPINQQSRDLLAAIRADFAAHGVDLPVYWGNRNWHPMLADTVAADARRRRSSARWRSSTSAYGGYSSCRQYLEDIAAARAAVGPERADDRQAAAVPRPPRLRRAARRRGPAPRWPRSTRPAGPPPGWSSPPTRSRSSMAAAAGPQRRPVRGAAARDRAAGGRARPPPTCLGPGLAEPLRPAARAVAGAGRQRPPGGAGGRRASPRSWSARSGSSPTTWRWSGTWTTRPPATARAARAWTSPGPAPPAPTPGSWRWSGSWSGADARPTTAPRRALGTLAGLGHLPGGLLSARRP